MKIIFASHNKGKIAELQALAQHFKLDIIPQSQLNISEADETGATFVENALLKARHASEKSGMPAIADDSGIVVPYLQGAPGIISARYAGTHGDAQANIDKLLAELKDVSEENRHAYFYCALVYLESANDPTPLICEGIWHGHVLTSPQGVDGHGYDPIFYVAEQHCSAAELSLEKKNLISHRGQALRLLMDKFNQRYTRTEQCTHSK